VKLARRLVEVLVGLLGIVAALRWVRVHAERFGGDPDCVTLFSGGGACFG
jgi:carboxylesterase type B